MAYYSKVSVRSIATVHGRFEMSGMPLPSRSRPSSAAPPLPNVKNDSSLAAMAEVGARLVTAAWKEPAVMAAFETIKPTITPFFIDVRSSEGPSIYKTQGTLGKPIYPDDPEHPDNPNAVPLRPEASWASAAAGGAAAGASRVSSPTASLRRSGVGLPGTAGSLASQAPRGSGAAAAASRANLAAVVSDADVKVELAAVMELPHFKAFAEYVLDNALVGVLQDGATGEVALHTRTF